MNHWIGRMHDQKTPLQRWAVTIPQQVEHALDACWFSDQSKDQSSDED